MQSLLMCFSSALDGFIDIEQALLRQPSYWSPEIGMCVLDLMVVPLAAPDMVGLGCTARWRYVKRLSGFGFTAGCRYRAMCVKWWNWQRTLTTSKLAQVFMASLG